MARVMAFRVDGVQMWFYSGDHRPPHFHARRPGEWTVRVFIQESEDSMIEFVGPPGAIIKAADRKAIVKGVQANRPALLREWERSQGHDQDE